MVALQDYMTFAEYLAWEAEQELKYEYVDGQVYAMTGGTLAHSAIAARLCAAIINRIAGKPCQVFSPDAKVCISELGPCFYPDVSVSCDRRDLSANQFLQHPCLIVEILSPSTEAYDRGKKFAQYRRIETLQEYVLVSSEAIAVEVYRRANSGKWEYIPYGPEDKLQLNSLDLNIPVADLYENVTLLADADAS
ncbi:Uma2 family endonuclease [Synechococcus sp. PCC 7336]|uniref:Uma2 family endonuclease n=1 Tax=Synechococcus sp. PCC 7336 TaxID=195250 RepID=UPI0003465588|nr:Uma2 family endonuclease [Synechococcus sp. PCC 7336]